MSEEPAEYQVPSTAGWRCACGATPDPADGAWRWTGTAWEHNHGGQAGHFRACYLPDLPETVPWPDDSLPQVTQKWPGASLEVSLGCHVFVGKGEDTGDYMLEFVTTTTENKRVRLAFAVRPFSARALHHLLGEALNSKECVFEVVDHTDDEIYYTAGIFHTLEEAKQFLNVVDPADLGSDCEHEDVAVFHVQRRFYGPSSGIGKVVYQRTWQAEWPEDNGDRIWHVQEVDL